MSYQKYEIELISRIEYAEMDYQHNIIKYAPYANFMGGIVLAIFLYNKINSTQIFYWLFILGLADLLYFAIHYCYRYNSKLPFSLIRWRILYFGVVATSAAVWGYAGYMLMPVNNLIDQFFIITLFFAMAAGMAQGTITDIWSCRASIGFVLLPLIIWAFKNGNYTFYAVGALITIYMLFLLLVTASGHKLFKKTFELQFKNSMLNQELANINQMLDIKVIEQTEALKRAKEEAETANKAKTDFLNIVTYELKAPFKAIDDYLKTIKYHFLKLFKGYRLAKEKYLDISYITPQQFSLLPRLLTGIENELEASANFINMLRGNIDKLNIAETLDLECSVKGCIKLVLERYPFKANECELVKLREGKDFTFIGNQILIVHIMFNLLKNALQCIEEERKGHIEIWLESAEGKNHLNFKDTAKGIDPNVLPYIFDRYYTKSKGGTGLGLAFCQMIMKGIGGKIMCDSKLHEYTKFVLEFPAKN